MRLTDLKYGPLYEAAADFVDRALRADDSLVTPERAIWAAGPVADLYQRFVLNEDVSADSFENKLKRQVDGASTETMQLAGEILLVHLLTPIDIGVASKLALIERVLSWLPEPPQIPPRLVEGLDGGFAAGGMAFKTHRFWAISFLLEFTRAWKGLDDAARATALADPWQFKSVVWSVPPHSGFGQRRALLHLVFPDAFEAIVSEGHVRRICERFSGYVIEPTDDPDRMLVQIRQGLAEALGPFEHFWDPQIAELWLRPGEPRGAPGDGSVTTDVAPIARAWLVRGANVGGVNLVPEWLEEGYVSIGWHELGELATGLDTTSLLAHVKVAYPDDSPGVWRGATGNLNRFINLMQPGHLVLTVDGDRLYVGEIAGNAFLAPDGLPGAVRRRAVRWRNAETPASRAQIQVEYPSLYSRLRTLLTVTDLKDDVGAVSALIGLRPDAGSASEVVLPEISDELATAVYLPKEWLQSEIVELLAEKGQIVLYGPPGTGKTLIAQRVAEHLVREGGELELIQFHPSYSYEDFFEGFRPAQVDGGIGVSYELTPGPLRRIAEAAAADPEHPYVLIIDEINRGNVPKIFGELLFLLEYRESQVPLQYSPEAQFGLPKNLFLIGTMNTADRSIALVDAALRRRFYFVPFMPPDEPIRDVLRRWLESNNLDAEPADLLDALNKRIANDEVAIGPSYFITRDGSSPRLERVWKNAILPLLEEHYYGTGRDVRAEFSLVALRKDIVTAAGAEDSIEAVEQPATPGTAEDAQTSS